jgi:hypothetical protein
MYLTEEEARGKWCPQARVEFSRGSINRLAGGGWNGPANCIASECMMWRGIQETWIISKERYAKPRETFSADDFMMKYGNKGYCGLGGKP